MTKRRLIHLTRLFAIAATIGLLPDSYAAFNGTMLTIATEVKELRSSTVNGQNQLLLEIDTVIGPTGCKSSSVLLATQHHNVNTQAEIEALALHAFLNSESVVVSVPTELGHCIDGKPLVTDLKLLAVPAPLGNIFD